MSNIDKGFTVDILSLRDEVLMSAGTSNPLVSGYEAPQGSLFVHKNGTNSTLYLKNDVNDTDWNVVIATGIQPQKYVLAAPISSSGYPSFRQLFLNDVSNVVVTSPIPGDVLSFNGTNWVNINSTNIDVIVAIYTGTVPAMSGTTTIPLDNTNPTNTEGSQVWTRTITPNSTQSHFSMRMSCMVGASNANQQLILGFFRNGVCVYAAATGIQNRDDPAIVTFVHTDFPNTTSSVTYSVRMGLTANGSTWYINQVYNATLGGQTSTYELQEILPA